MVLPVFFVPVITRFPVGLLMYWMTTNLWTVGQGIVTRRMVPKPEPSAEAQLADAAEGGCRTAGTGSGAVAAAGHGCRPPACHAPPREAEEEADAEMTEEAELQVEATGETVGEAKWHALRELEQRAPGLDKAAVRFEVVSEGERGLLGVGYAPARVIASIDADAVSPEPGPAEPAGGEGDLAASLRELLDRDHASGRRPLPDRDQRGRRGRHRIARRRRPRAPDRDGTARRSTRSSTSRT